MRAVSTVLEKERLLVVVPTAVNRDMLRPDDEKSESGGTVSLATRALRDLARLWPTAATLKY